MGSGGGEALAGKILAPSVDGIDVVTVKSAVDTSEGDPGKIDIWRSAAMATILAPPLDKIAPEEFKCVSEVTYPDNV